MKLGSLFDGIGGFPHSAQQYGIMPVWASEICVNCIAITRRHFPNMQHLGDITLINGEEIEPVDIITFGSPCFPAETMVLTDKGYVEIEHIRVGDMVLTHRGRWREVTDFGWKYAETYRCKGGITIETTAEHPIYSGEIVKDFSRKPCGKRNNKKGGIKNIAWLQAKDMKEKQWATPCVAELLPIPKFEIENLKQNKPPEINVDFWYFVGRWLGDGWVRDSQRHDRPHGQTSGTILLSDSRDKECELISTVSKIAKNYSVSHDRTVVKVKFTSQILCKWLVRYFGKGSKNKTIPSWTISLDKDSRTALLQGIIESDGHKLSETRVQITSVSKRLVLGLRLLAESLGYNTSVVFFKRPKTSTIEGRTVNQSDTYTIVINRSESRKAGIVYGGHTWYKCKDVEKTDKVKRVYNISVQEDESYVADSIVVHNCQSWSVAGNREGLEGESGLFNQAIRVISEMLTATDDEYPKYIIFENVPGLLSQNSGDDFRYVMECLQNLGQGFLLDANILDSQYMSVPQRRRRVFVVGVNSKHIESWQGYDYSEGLSNTTSTGQFMFGDSNNGHVDKQRLRACRSLLERRIRNRGEQKIFPKSESVSRDIAPRREARQKVTAGVGNGAKKSNRGTNILNPACPQRWKVMTTDSVCPTLDAGDGGGGRGANILFDAYQHHGFRESDVSNPITAGQNNTIRGDTPLIVRMREGCDGGGKGALISEDKSLTLGTGNDQVLVLNDQGGAVMNVSENVVGTLRAEAHGHIPIVAGFNGHKSASAGSIQYAEDVAPTLESNMPPNVMSVHQNADGELRVGNVANTLNQNSNASGRNAPVVCIQGSMIGRGDKNGPQGSGINEDTSFTLNTTDRHAVAVMRTDQTGSNGLGVTEDVTYTLDGTTGQAVCSENNQHGGYKEGIGTLKASGGDIGGGSENLILAAQNRMIVRRLTPKECERLMTFPDGWTEYGVDENGNEVKISDSARYRALGNSCVIKCLDYLFENIVSIGDINNE